MSILYKFCSLIYHDFTASSYVKDTKFIIQGLKKGTPYLFRVSAENEIGVGKTLEGKEPVFVKSPFGKSVYIFKFKAVLNGSLA